VLYTDGITEAENPQGEAFDDAGLEGVVARTWMSDPQQIGKALLADVERFAGDARLADDLTALVLKRGSVPGAAPAEAAG
jgi:sigma-B regulation protein RsbU (phosphoserine phosphatase)